VRYDVQSLTRWSIVNSTTYVQMREHGDMIRKDSMFSKSDVLSNTTVYTWTTDNTSAIDFVVSMVLLAVTFIQLLYFSMHMDDGNVSTEMEWIRYFASVLEDFELVGTGLTEDLSYWIVLGPSVFVIIVFVGVMSVQELVEQKAFLTGSKCWRLCFVSISGCARIMSTVCVLPLLKILLNVFNFQYLILDPIVGNISNGTLVSDAGSVANFDWSECMLEDTVERPLSSSKYLIEDGDNFTEFLDTTHIVYVATVILCLALYLPYVYRLQRVCGDLKRINATLNPFDMSGDDTNGESVRKNPLSPNGDYRYDLGLLVCKLALTVTTVIFLGQAQNSPWTSIMGQFVIFALGICIASMAFYYPPYFLEMKIVSDIFLACNVSIVWAYFCSFVTVILYPACDMSMGIDMDILVLVRFYVPMLSWPLIFFGTLWQLDRCSTRPGALTVLNEKVSGIIQSLSKDKRSRARRVHPVQRL